MFCWRKPRKEARRPKRNQGKLFRKNQAAGSGAKSAQGTSGTETGSMSELRYGLGMSAVSSSEMYLPPPCPPRVVSALIDGSFSMLSIWRSIRDGHEKFVKHQLEIPGEAVYSLRMFDTMQSPIYQFAPKEKAGPIPETYCPRGNTACMDTVYMEIVRIDKFLEQNPRYSKVTLFVMTDGGENMSRLHTVSEVKKLVGDRIQQGWDIVMGVSDQAVQQAVCMGIQNVVHYDVRGMESPYKYSGRSSAHSLRFGCSVNAGFDASESDETEGQVNVET